MPEQEACLHLRAQQQRCKITGLVNVLPFAGDLKLLANAIDSGAPQECVLSLCTASGARHELRISFLPDVLALELVFAGRSRFSVQLTGRAFVASVEAMLAKLPDFF